MNSVAAAEQILRKMLNDRRLDISELHSFARLWEVFKEFTEVPFECSDDGVLYQCGVYSFRGLNEFCVAFVRQFELAERSGVDEHLEQLRCEFRFALDDQTGRLASFDRWWFVSEGEHAWNDFVHGIEQRPEFVTLRNVTPRAMLIEQGWV